MRLDASKWREACSNFVKTRMAASAPRMRIGTRRRAVRIGTRRLGVAMVETFGVYVPNQFRVQILREG